MSGNKRKRRRLPEVPVELSIESLAHDGRGVAHLDGKAVFVHGALPGELVRARLVARYSKYSIAETVEVIKAAAERVTPKCAHFAKCGGCSLQHMKSEAQIQAKQQILLDQLQRIGRVNPQQIYEPLAADRWGYRRKARLGVRNVPKKGRVLVGFREKDSNYIAELSRCEVLDSRIGLHLLDLAALIGRLSLVDRIPQIEVAMGDETAALVFRTLDQPTSEDCDLLKAFGRQHSLQIYLQPGGPEVLVQLWPEQSSVLEYRAAGDDLRLQFLPTDFTQINASINRAMIQRAIDLLAPGDSHRVLDLFCGLGNFTLPLSRHAGCVVGVEGEAGLIARARDNAHRNGIANVEFHVADLTSELAHAQWLKNPYDGLLIDPPRTGALEVLHHLPRIAAPRVVYVSCNPATLARDAGELVHRYGYRLVGAGAMDMFPHTGHVESIALFEKTV